RARHRRLAAGVLDPQPTIRLAQDDERLTLPGARRPYVREVRNLVGRQHADVPARPYLGEALLRLGRVQPHVRSAWTDLVLLATPVRVVAVTHRRHPGCSTAGHREAAPTGPYRRRTSRPASRFRRWSASASALRGEGERCRP